MRLQLDISHWETLPGNAWCSRSVWMTEWTQFSWALTSRAYTRIENHFHPSNVCILRGVYAYSVSAHSLSSTHFQKARRQHSSCCDTLYRFYFVLCGSHAFFPYNLERVSFIIGAFLMSRSPPPVGPPTQRGFPYSDEGCLPEWHLGGAQYMEVENSLIICHHCPFKHIPWYFFSPPRCITHFWKLKKKQPSFHWLKCVAQGSK